MRRTIESLALLAAIGLVATTVAFAGRPQPPPPTGPWDIAYGSQTTNSGDLTLMQADGRDKFVAYTAVHPHYPRLPDWSHDGKYVSFNVYNIEGRVLQLASGKTCLLHSPHGTSPQPMKFHPSFGEAAGDGRYVASWTNWGGHMDMYIAAFKFREGNCEILWIDNVSPRPANLDYYGTAWSPLGNDQTTQLATIVRNYDVTPWAWLLRIFDVTMTADGHMILGAFTDYPLDASLSYSAGFGGPSGWSLQWSPDPNRLGLVAASIPPGSTTQYWDVYSIDISTNPPIMTNITNSAANESYFDFRANGDGIIVGNGDGIFRFPANGAPVCIAPPERKKWPRDPAWNPTQTHD